MQRSYGNRRPSRTRKPADPVLMGEPSPALTKIARMNTEKLAEHIKKMKVEADRLETKVSNLKKITPVDEERVAELTLHRERLAALMTAAAERLSGKLERKAQRASGGGSGGYR